MRGDLVGQQAQCREDHEQVAETESGREAAVKTGHSLRVGTGEEVVVEGAHVSAPAVIEQCARVWRQSREVRGQHGDRLEQYQLGGVHLEASQGREKLFLKRNFIKI